MEELPVISATYEVYKKLVELNAGLDKKYRHTLGEPVVTSCSAILKQLILAKHTPKPLKASYLIQADATAELTALKIRTILELNLANETNILKVQARLSEARRHDWRLAQKFIID